jgi:hypothetical protein
MPERNRPPYAVEMMQRVERMERAWAAERETQAAERDALLIVRYFNAHLSANGSAGFWPTVKMALTARHPWVQILCESCGCVTDLDLSFKRRDPEASIRAALKDLRCPRCNGHGRPRIIGLASRPSI